MPPELSLEELKAQNKAEEDKELDVSQETNDDADNEDEADEAEAGAHEDEADAEDGEAAGSDDEEEGDKKGAVEDWMKTGDDDDDDAPAKKFGDGDMAKARRKYRAKLDAKETENETLRRENAELKSGGNKPPQQLDQPDRDSFDTEEEYQDARADYRADKRDADNQARFNHAQRKEAQNNEQIEINANVDEHYSRAVTLAEDSGISQEMYQGTDARVRDAFRGRFGGAGEAIIDKLISDLGEGSEKVMYNIGVNTKRLDELMAKFDKDGTGMQAGMYLATLNSELSAPKRRRTTAPKPAPKVNGDGIVVKQGAKALKKAYDDEADSSDLTKRFAIRREARKQGFDISDW